MSAVLRIAREEWRLLRRDRVAVLGLTLLLLLTAVAAFTAWDQRHSADAQRSRHQAQVDHEFEAQPERHPHRMVHYGHFVFRPLNPLAAFDSGVDAYTGHTLYLEGHGRTVLTSEMCGSLLCCCASASSRRPLCCRCWRLCC